MTKETIKATLEEIIIRHGFTFEYLNHTWLPVVRQTNEDYAGITFQEHWDFNREEMSCTTTITCQSRVCQMGSNPSYMELVNAADQISRAAQLMLEVNTLALSYTEHLGA